MDNELYHYGVKGQKWGVRRYQNEDGSLTEAGKKRYLKTGLREFPGSADSALQAMGRHIEKIGSSKTRLGKNYHNSRALWNEYKALKRDDLTEALAEGSYKGTHRKAWSVRKGSFSAANRSSAWSHYYNRKAEYVKTNLAKHLNEARAFNFGSMAKRYTDIGYEKGLRHKALTAITSYNDMPYQRLSGRQTTAGKNLVDNMLRIGEIKDLKFLLDKKKKE